MKRTILMALLWGLSLCALPAQSANPADSILTLYNNARTDTARIRLGFEWIDARTRQDAPIGEILEAADRQMALARQVGDSLSMGRVWYARGMAYQKAGRYEQAVETFSACIKIIREGMMPVQRIGALNQLGNAYRRIGQPEKAEALFLRALREAHDLDDPVKQAYARNNLAILKAEQGDLAGARDEFKACLDLYTQAGDSGQVAVAANNLGITHMKLGNYVDAIRLMQRSARIDEAAGDLLGMAIQYQNIAVLHKRSGNYEAGLVAIDKSFEGYKKLTNARGMTKALVARHNLLKKLDRMDEAYETIRQARDTCLKYDLKDVPYAHVLVGLSDFLEQNAQYDEAIRNLKEAEQIFSKAGLDEQFPSIYHGLGICMYQQGLYKEARNYLEVAYEQTREQMDPYKLRQMHEALAKVYESTGIPQKAIYHLREERIISDSLNNLEKHKQIQEIQAAYDVEKYQRQLEEGKRIQAESDLETQTLNNRNRLLVVLICSLLVIGVVVIFYFRYRSQQKELINRQRRQLMEQQLEQEQAEKNRLRQLSLRQAQDIGKKNRMLTELKAEMEQLQEKSSGVQPEEFVHVFKLIEHNIHSEADWEAFKQNFEQIFPGFIPQLVHRFAGLSPAEIRLCTLVRLGMNQKEMASVLNIHPDSVKKARTRLRKKLELETDTSLRNFLGSI